MEYSKLCPPEEQHQRPNSVSGKEEGREIEVTEIIYSKKIKKEIITSCGSSTNICYNMF